MELLRQKELRLDLLIACYFFIILFNAIFKKRCLFIKKKRKAEPIIFNTLHLGAS
jgi:hypothetical protein